MMRTRKLSSNNLKISKLKSGMENMVKQQNFGWVIWTMFGLFWTWLNLWKQTDMVTTWEHWIKWSTFSFDIQNYATEELLNGSISVSRSFVPSSRCQLDKTIEETIRKHAKCHKQASGGKGGGLFGVENFLTYCLIISLQN